MWIGNFSFVKNWNSYHLCIMLNYTQFFSFYYIFLIHTGNSFHYKITCHSSVRLVNWLDKRYLLLCVKKCRKLHFTFHSHQIREDLAITRKKSMYGWDYLKSPYFKIRISHQVSEKFLNHEQFWPMHEYLWLKIIQRNIILSEMWLVMSD